VQKNQMRDTQKAGELNLLTATHKALDYVHQAIATAPSNIGSGHGPLNHLSLPRQE